MFPPFRKSLHSKKCQIWWKWVPSCDWFSFSIHWKWVKFPIKCIFSQHLVISSVASKGNDFEHFKYWYISLSWFPSSGFNIYTFFFLEILKVKTLSHSLSHENIENNTHLPTNTPLGVDQNVKLTKPSNTYQSTHLIITRSKTGIYDWKVYLSHNSK